MYFLIRQDHCNELRMQNVTECLISTTFYEIWLQETKSLPSLLHMVITVF